MDEEKIVPLIGGHARLDPMSSTSLRHLSAERAATSMTECFRATGAAQAHVNDPDEVRRLARLDCRRRGIRVRTIATGDLVVVYDDDRYAEFLKTPRGEEYQAEMTRRMHSAFTSVLPPTRRTLRSVPSDD